MEAAIEERVTSLENALGINDRTEVKTTDFDVFSVTRSLEKKGLNHILKVPRDDLKRLRNFLEQPSTKPFSEQLSIVQCGEELARKRVALLEDLESRLKVVLDCTHLSGIDEHEKKLEETNKEIQEGLLLFKQHSDELREFIGEYSCIMQGLQEKLNTLEVKVMEKEAKKL